LHRNSHAGMQFAFVRKIMCVQKMHENTLRALHTPHAPL